MGAAKDVREDVPVVRSTCARAVTNAPTKTEQEIVVSQKMNVFLKLV